MAIEIYEGLKFGQMTVLNIDEDGTKILRLKGRGETSYNCKCSCGKIKQSKDAEIRVSIKNNANSTCGLCYTFEDWCNDNNHQDYLDLWDCELNKCKPSELGFGSNKKCWFKCERDIHESFSKPLSRITGVDRTNDLYCSKCNSIGQYIIDTYGENGLAAYWSDKNSKSPFEVMKSSGSANKIWIKCDVNSHPDYSISPANFRAGYRCPVCVNRKVVYGVNDVLTTHPHLERYIADKSKVKYLSYGSKEKTRITCPDCKHVKYMQLNTLIQYGIGCTCGNGTSMPEKFIISLLRQLGVNYKYQVSKTYFKWAEKYIYDFYIPELNAIIEVHGGQHYEEGFSRCGGKSLEEVLNNDKGKHNLAEYNGILNYITIDCRHSCVEWIKNSVISSELPKLLGFKEDDIDWEDIEMFALFSNIKKEICDYWSENSHMTTTEMSEIFPFDRHTIMRYLKFGTKHGWCNYNVDEAIKRRYEKAKILNRIKSSKRVEAFKGEESLGIYESCVYLANISRDLFGIKLDNGKISSVCRGDQKSHKGFTFRYVDSPEQSTNEQQN